MCVCVSHFSSRVYLSSFICRVSSNRSMQGQQINLKWKSFHSSILSSFENLWEEEGLVDVTIAADGRCLKAHKIMLSASSPFFKKIFQMNPCQHPVIVLQDIHFSELESILEFVYRGEVNILQDSLPLLLRAAETLQIRGLCRHLGSDDYEESDGKESDIENQDHVESLKTPLSSPKTIKKLKSHHIYKPSLPPPPLFLAPAAGLSVNVYPVDVENIKHEQRPDSPARPDSRCDHPVESPNSSSQIRIIDSDGEDNDMSSNVNEGGFELDPASKTFPYSPFPCPFCDRAYARWGFRRRHIKACHTRTKSLPCKWCLEVLPTHTDWESHVCSKHSLSRSDARNGLLILEEAEVVLQIPQPTRLEALVTMIKEQKNDQLDESSKLVEHFQKEDKGEKGLSSKCCGRDKIRSCRRAMKFSLVVFPILRNFPEIPMTDLDDSPGRLVDINLVMAESHITRFLP